MLNMKNIIIMKYLYFFIILAFTFSCTNLEPVLYSDLTTANAYATESDLDAALVGVYSTLGPGAGDSYLYRAGYFVAITDYATDMSYSPSGDIGKMSTSTYDPNNRYFGRTWKYIYKLIADANILLSNTGAVDMDETKKKEIEGQARFLRALAYLDLTDAWGPVPLLTEPIDPTEAFDMPLSPVSEVDAVIISDCEFAIANLPDQWAPEAGLARATKGAAATILAKVYLRAHDYTNAKTYVDMVLQLRDNGVYTLNPDFKDVFSLKSGFSV